MDEDNDLIPEHTRTTLDLVEFLRAKLAGLAEGDEERAALERSLELAQVADSLVYTYGDPTSRAASKELIRVLGHDPNTASSIISILVSACDKSDRYLRDICTGMNRLVSETDAMVAEAADAAEVSDEASVKLS